MGRSVGSGRAAFRRAVLLAVAVAAATSAQAAPQRVSVWVATSAEKIRPSAPARAEAVVRVSAARNEHEAFQVVVTGNARRVTATATALSGPGTLAAPRLHRAALIDLARRSAPDGATGRWPDALVPDVDELDGQKRNAFPFDVPAGESRAIWAEVLVPASAAPGLYRGEIRVTHAKGTVRIPVELTVHDFAIPSTSSVRSAFGLPWGALPAGHGFSASDATTFAALRARYGRFALDHRISLSRHDDGLWNDLGWFETWYGSLADGRAPTRLAGARLGAIEYLGGLEDVGAMSRWADHHGARGRLDRLFQYTCDEPPLTCTWDEVRRRASAAKAADPELRTLVTTSIQAADANGVTAAIDLLVPSINHMDDKSGAYAGNQRRKYDAFLAANPRAEVWLYQSCMSHGCGAESSYDVGWASYVIDASAVRNRAMAWLLFRYEASGELYWDTTYAYELPDPWRDQWAFGGNGDGTLFYPGTPARIGGTSHVPVASIRLKAIRDGLEDLEYLRLVAELGDPALAFAIADELFPCASCTDRSPAQLLAARDRLARRILELSGAATP